MMFSRSVSAQPRPPVIIAGMHRSGTSVLTTILDDLGLFVGKAYESNHEALFFLRLNNWLLRQAGAAWDYPEPFHDFLKYDDMVSARVAHLDHFLSTPRAIEFLGLKNYLALGSVKNLTQPWGWKDPRNTFTLPLWLKIFPDAKLLVINRHGVDVAKSLATRADKVSKILESEVDTTRRWKWRLPLSTNSFARCRDVDQGMALWRLYTDTAERYAQELKERALVLRYETFLDDPVAQLEKVTGFVGLDVDKNALCKATGRINSSRAYSYRGTDTLRSLAGRYQSDLSAFGYTA